MIGYLKGEVAAIYDDRIIIEVGGIGYNVFMPASSLDLIEGTGAFVKIYTYLQVREDAMQLYGFLTKDDLDLYKMLISVNGIGPKGALALLSVMTCDELRFAILSGDDKQIGKAPGIGPKTAQRVIIDLKDKIDIDISYDNVAGSARTSEDNTLTGIKEEAAQALIALGYSSTESFKAVRSIESDSSDDVESILKKALSFMSKF